MKLRRSDIALPSVVLFGAALLLCASESMAQSRNGESILREVEKRFSLVQDFTATLDVVADIERLNVPPMHARMYFKQPDKVHFESEGTAILPKEGVMLSIARLTAKFTAELIGSEEFDGHHCYKLNLKPKDEKTAAHGMIVFVDSARLTPVRIVSSLPDGRTVTAAFEVADVAGHWMPSMLTVTFATQAADSSDVLPPEQEVPGSRRQPPRKGSVTIRYSDYTINTGLSDALFEKGAGTRK